MASHTPPHTRPHRVEVTPPESVEDDGALVKLNARVEQLGGHDGGVAKTGRLAADFFTVEDDVFSVSSEEERGGSMRITWACPLHTLEQA